MLSLGLDFGTESGRALLVDAETGEIVASAVYPYRHGVIDERLPGSDVRLEPEWALQNPEDYVDVLRNAVPEAMRAANARPEDVIGIGVDFTACTLVPIDRAGIPLSSLDAWRSRPHAWGKLWKHHAAHPEATRINACARERNEAWHAEYGTIISSEWLHSKALQVLEEDPEIFGAIDRFVEAGDWIVMRMTGRLVRNACAAGYKGLWGSGRKYPNDEFLATLDPRMKGFNETKLAGDIVPPGSRVGGLTEEAASWMGLRPGIPVAAATIDAHAAVPGAGVTETGRMVIIMGTSSCHMLLGDEMQLVPGISGVVRDGIIEGFYGYEAGQAAVGDIFGWFVRNAAPADRREENSAPQDLHARLERDAAALKPGESGLLALDWWNGVRTPLVDAELSGAIIGLTLGTRPHEIYRALIEATAFGTRLIVETFEEHGVPVREIVACGGLAERNALLLDIYADVLDRPIRVAGSPLTSALGAAMFGAVAAGSAGGGYDTIADAAAHMASPVSSVHRPNPDHSATYDALYADYKVLVDYFGRSGNDVMRRLRGLRQGSAEG